MQERHETEQGISKAKKIAQQAFEQALEAIVQAFWVLKALIQDPLEGQSRALKNLGQANAFRAGIVLVVLFAISCLLLGHSLIAGFRATAQQFGGSIGVSLRIYLRLFLYSLIPAVSVFSCYVIIMKLLSQEQKKISVCLYTTGVSTIPLAFLFLCVKIFGLDNPKLLATIGVFCLSTTFLMINGSLQFIYKLSSPKSVLITPTLVLLAGYVSLLLLVLTT